MSFDSSASATKYPSWRNFRVDGGCRFIECIAKVVGFLFVAKWATSLQNYYFFEKMILGDGCVRVRFQAAGQGLGFPATRGGDGKSPMLS